MWFGLWHIDFFGSIRDMIRERHRSCIRRGPPPRVCSRSRPRTHRRISPHQNVTSHARTYISPYINQYAPIACKAVRGLDATQYTALRRILRLRGCHAAHFTSHFALPLHPRPPVLAPSTAMSFCVFSAAARRVYRGGAGDLFDTGTDTGKTPTGPRRSRQLG